MGKFLQKYGILFFFCAMMGGIIMVDSIFAIAWGCGRFLGPELSNSKTASILHRTQTP